MWMAGVETRKEGLPGEMGEGIGERREEGGNMSEICEEMSEEMCEEMCEKIGKNMGKKMEEKRCEGKRETVIYRVRSPRQNAEDGVKQLEVRRRKRSHA
jgi:hypothetical protein